MYSPSHGDAFTTFPGRPSCVFTASGACGSVSSRTLNTAPLWPSARLPAPMPPASIEFACERSHRRAVFLCADTQGFRPHAAVFRDADDSEALEQLCRHITRPALANARGHCNAARQVVLKRKRAWRAGTTDLMMPPMVFM